MYPLFWDLNTFSNKLFQSKLRAIWGRSDRYIDKCEYTILKAFQSLIDQNHWRSYYNPEKNSPMEAHNGCFDEDEDEDDDATTKHFSCHVRGNCFPGFLLPSRDDVLGIYQPCFSIFSH